MENTLAPYLVMFFMLLALGYLLRRTGAMPEVHIHWLVSLITTVPLPALVLSALARAAFDWYLLGVWAVGLIVTLSAMGIAWLVGLLLHLKPGARAVLVVAGSLSNTGFLGTPLIASLFHHRPDYLAAAVTYDMGVTALLVHTLGAGVLAHEGTKVLQPHAPVGLQRLVQMPVFWATGVGYLLMIGGMRLPEWLMFSLERVGQTTVPLALLATGAMIRLRTLGTRWRLLALVALYKCVGVPLLMGGVLWLTSLPEPAERALLLQSAMPSVMVSALYASLYGTEPEVASSVVVLSVVLALSLIPLWLYFPLG
ncbi:MAG: AEC family transporter [Fimbriimonadales bacterium]